jgi:hypothetical protein
MIYNINKKINCWMNFERWNVLFIKKNLISNTTKHQIHKSISPCLETFDAKNDGEYDLSGILKICTSV